MVNFYIPACGDRLILEKDWEFDLYLEYRNTDFAKALDLLPKDDSGHYEKGGGYSAMLLKRPTVTFPKR
jgi:hypothetical protein